MDAAKAKMATMGTCSIFCSILCGVSCCVLQIVLIVYMGIYAFNNPDPQAYYDPRAVDDKLKATADVSVKGVEAVHD